MMNDLVLVFDTDQEMDLVFEDSEGFSLTVGDDLNFPEYTGAMEFTPTREVQFAFTAGKIVLDNIKINPIPSNYGLVTYNGHIITIS